MHRIWRWLAVGVIVAAACCFAVLRRAEPVVTDGPADTEPAVTEAPMEPALPSIETFVARYNAIADTPIEDLTAFDVLDRDGGHYRTEYRLGAFSGAVAASGAVGDGTVDVINYRDGRSIRAYFVIKELDDVIAALRAGVAALDADAPGEDVERVIGRVQSLGDCNGFAVGRIVTGAIIKNQMSMS